MSKTTIGALCLAAALTLGAEGCSHSNVEKHYGEAYREMVARQTDQPEAAEANAEKPLPQGLDGQTGAGVVTGYRKSEQGPAGPELPLPMIVTDQTSLGGR
jgi:hypothetical protein